MALKKVSDSWFFTFLMYPQDSELKSHTDTWWSLMELQHHLSHDRLLRDLSERLLHVSMTMNGRFFISECEPINIAELLNAWMHFFACLFSLKRV